MRITGNDWTYKRISFDEVTDLPETVFKYRDWNDMYHRTILTEQIVFFARPTSFPDPLDCKSQKRYDLMNDKDIFDMYLRKSAEDHPTWNRQQHRQFAKLWTKKSPLHDKKYVNQMQEEAFFDFDSQFGVLSLTADPVNYEMWDKYSNHHHGFCVGFNFQAVYPYFGGGIPVQYDALPDILWDDPQELEFFKQVGFKEKKWVFEKEYRAHKFDPKLKDEKNRMVKIPGNCFTHVIFGAKMPDQDRNEIIDVCRGNGLDVDFFEEVIVNGSTEIILNKIIA